MPISPQERKYHNTHNRNITQAEARIDGAFAEVVQGVTRIYQLYDFSLPEGGAFQFEQATPAARKAADKVFANMRKRILETIQAGADAADKLSQQKAEKLTRLYDAATQLRREQTTARSLQEISDAVWKQSEQLRAEMELALSVALKSGASADDLVGEIRGYLNEPNKLFRRVRDEFGNLVLSKAAAAYHPGRGVYRSSYKNARRLAATEINMAYRKADYDRWQKLDFVIGVRIALSREHPYYDMCDELAGDYPKDFVFVGWHPHCRCIATPILQNIEDFKNGVPPEEDLFKVDKIPDNFNKWVLNNEIRINRALSGQSTMPFFLRDNKGAMEKALSRKFEDSKSKTKELKEAAKPLRQKLITHPIFKEKIRISQKTIREWINQPFRYKEEKDKMLLDICEILPKTTYIGTSGNPKNVEDVVNTHVFKVIVRDINAYILVREYKWGDHVLHSITDAQNFELYVTKKK